MYTSFIIFNSFILFIHFVRVFHCNSQVRHNYGQWLVLLASYHLYCDYACMVTYQQMYIGVITGDLPISYTVWSMDRIILSFSSYHSFLINSIRTFCHLVAIYDWTISVGSISMAEAGATSPISLTSFPCFHCIRLCNSFTHSYI